MDKMIASEISKSRSEKKEIASSCFLGREFTIRGAVGHQNMICPAEVGVGLVAVGYIRSRAGLGPGRFGLWEVPTARKVSRSR
jgi:hypothetical protein